jgi:hypothetical protein
MAGIQALINQKAGGPQGNPAPIYYQLAAAQYGASGNASCNSSNGAGVGASCIFYDVTDGDMDVDCTGPNCYLGGGAAGVLSTSNNSFSPAYGTSLGWDFATGIGTINAANLVNNWPASAPPPGSFSLSATPNSLNVVAGNSSSSTIAVIPQNGFSGSVSLSASGLPAGATVSFNPNGTTSTSMATFAVSASAAPGTFTVTVKGVSGNLSSSTTVSLTVTATPDFTLAASPTSLSIKRGATGSATISIVPSNGFSGAVTISASGLRKGVSASFSPNPTINSSTLTLATSNKTNIGTFTVTISGVFAGLSHVTNISVSVHR